MLIAESNRNKKVTYCKQIAC